MNKIYFLVDNIKTKGFESDKAFSLYIQRKNQKDILFDSGRTSLFLENAKKLNLSISNIDDIILSHGHFDHGNGLRFIDTDFKKRNLIACSEIFTKRYRKKDNSYLGMALCEAYTKDSFNLILKDTPYFLDDNLCFLGHIKRYNDFEAKETDFILENNEDDFVIDDSAIVFRGQNGLVIIAGCSHSGICNIIEYSKEIMNESKIDIVLGGFHLHNIDSKLQKTIDYLNSQDINKIYISHCTKDIAYDYLNKNLSIRNYRTKVSDIVEFLEK